MKQEQIWNIMADDLNIILNIWRVDSPHWRIDLISENQIYTGLYDKNHIRQTLFWNRHWNVHEIEYIKRNERGDTAHFTSFVAELPTVKSQLWWSNSVIHSSRLSIPVMLCKTFQNWVFH